MEFFSFLGEILNLDNITANFIKKHREYCSYITFRWWQVLFYLSIAGGLIFLLAYRWDISLCLITFYVSFWYFCAAFFRGAAVFISLSGRGERKVTADEIAKLHESELPVYTILVPLYKEANIADKIVFYLEKLDYPKEKLDVKLLLEEDDTATISVLNLCQLPPYFEKIIIPDCLPKTKPRACNFGLERARGEFCVIYDAEDRPEPDQLKKAFILFKKLPENYVCVQAKLNYYNPKQNLLTKLFTIEYSTTFDLLLPGLEVMNIPIPLGGTSNHFRTNILKKLGGWDPFNVTEDCELGIRIYAKGYKTCLLDSTTWEEANSKLWNWVRQRSRWVKGFLQTHLAHMRYPLKTFKSLGLWGTFGFYMCVGASSFMMIINVFYWLVGLFYVALIFHGLSKGLTLSSMIKKTTLEGYEGFELLGRQIKAWPLLYVGIGEDPFWSTLSIIFFTIGCALVLANILFVIYHFLACLKRRYFFLIPYSFLMPFYWVLISFGAWKGLVQLFTKPFYWEKTVHGLSFKDLEEESLKKK